MAEGMQPVKFDLQKIDRYRRAGYKIIGPNRHTGVKLCRWARSALKKGRLCYKRWYGVSFN